MRLKPEDRINDWENWRMHAAFFRKMLSDFSDAMIVKFVRWEGTTSVRIEIGSDGANYCERAMFTPVSVIRRLVGSKAFFSACVDMEGVPSTRKIKPFSHEELLTRFDIGCTPGFCFFCSVKKTRSTLTYVLSKRGEKQC